MFMSLVRKELRETRAFVALAAFIYIAYVSKLTGTGGPIFGSLVSYVPGMNVSPRDIPFVQDNFTSMLVFVGAALAIVLGFRQSAWEPSQGTSLYLLHLPMSRRDLLLTKLLTGSV